MSEPITIVDRGRGPQLSTSRVTVQDLVQYFQEGCSTGEIIRWIPTLTPEEIAVARRYYIDHQLELNDVERRIRERSVDRKNPDWIQEILAGARLERQRIMARLRGNERNGAAD